MQTPLVSITVPIFKCEDFLERCLLSVLEQTYENLEVILINDQTPDNSVNIAEQFIQQNNLQNTWKIFHLEENSGLSVVRNKGIDTANGKYIYFLDSDDSITPDCISEMVTIAESEDNIDMVIGEVTGIYLESGEEADVFPIRIKENLVTGNDTIFEIFVNAGFPQASWNKLIRLDFLKKNNLYFVKGLYAQDSLHSFCVAQKLESIAILRKKTYNYFLHKNSVIHNRKEKHFSNWITIAQHIDETYKNEANPKRKKMILKYLINFKSGTLMMNWKAQKNEALWKKSYDEYKKTASLSVYDYFDPFYSKKEKKENFFNNLPTNPGFKIFVKRYNGNFLPFFSKLIRNSN